MRFYEKKNEKIPRGSAVKNSAWFCGFTLIELLVSTFIIISISSLTLAGHFAGQRVYKVSQAAQELTANLRRAQNLALAGNIQNSAKGFGVYAESQNSYLLFYNTDSSKIYQSPQSQTIERIFLVSGLKFDQIGFSVFFTPPDPTTFANGVQGASQQFKIQSLDGAVFKTVTAQANGRIDVN